MGIELMMVAVFITNYIRTIFLSEVDYSVVSPRKYPHIVPEGTTYI